MIGWQRAAMVLLVALLIAPPKIADAYDGPTTHAGITARALLGSKLHGFLRAQGFRLGLFHPLRLSRDGADRGVVGELLEKLEHVDHNVGCHPGAEAQQWALGWVVAGAVAAGMPAISDQHHFLDPTMPTGERGLQNGNGLSQSLFSFVAMVEGGGTVTRWLTGTGFDMTGHSALRFLRASDNAHGIATLRAALKRARTAPDKRQREHWLSRAMIALGHVLHVLQDMASPTHVRNDFSAGHLQRLSQDPFDRGNRYERLVATTFGRTGVGNSHRRITRDSIEAFFTTADWRGLADVTHARHFSPATLPTALKLTAEDSAQTLVERARKSTRYQFPRIDVVDLACARAARTRPRVDQRTRRCYARGQGRRLAAIRLDQNDVLHFFLDSRVLIETARIALPSAVAFSRGLVDHIVATQLDSPRNAKPSKRQQRRRIHKRERRLNVFSKPTSRPTSQPADVTTAAPASLPASPTSNPSLDSTRATTKQPTSSPSP